MEMRQGGLFVASRVTWGLYSFTRPFHGFSASPFVHGDPAGLVFPLMCFEVGDSSVCLAVCAGRGGLGNQALRPHPVPPLAVGPRAWSFDTSLLCFPSVKWNNDKISLNGDRGHKSLFTFQS